MEISCFGFWFANRMWKDCESNDPEYQKIRDRLLYQNRNYIQLETRRFQYLISIGKTKKKKKRNRSRVSSFSLISSKPLASPFIVSLPFYDIHRVPENPHWTVTNRELQRDARFQRGRNNARFVERTSHLDRVFHCTSEFRCLTKTVRVVATRSLVRSFAKLLHRRPRFGESAARDSTLWNEANALSPGNAFRNLPTWRWTQNRASHRVLLVVRRK